LRRSGRCRRVPGGRCRSQLPSYQMLPFQDSEATESHRGSGSGRIRTFRPRMCSRRTRSDS
jgi:hypothetical protein